jgi:uncharacterized protein YlxP (DUF503 family)
MTIGLLTLELSIPDARSLKDKRRPVRGLKDKIRHRWNASVAEVGDLEMWTEATLAVVLVANDHAYVAERLQAIVEFAHGAVDALVTETRVEFL